MGYALAAAALARGGEVTLITGPTHLTPPAGIHLIRVTTAEEMFTASLNQAQGADLILKAAAVADYRPAERARGKLKKATLNKRARRAEAADRTIALRLVATPDILEELGRRKKPGQVLVGFAAETHDLQGNARKKLRRKQLDLIVANRIGGAGEGFASETNRALVLDRDGGTTELPLMSKEEIASAILDRVERLLPPDGLRTGSRRAS